MPNPLCHYEFMTGDSAQCQAFYGKVFDWQFDDKSIPGYTLINAGSEPSGAVFPKPDSAPGPCMNIYFQVSDIDDTLEKAKEHGGEVLIEKTVIPGTGHFAMFTDPEGIVVGIMQPEG